MRKIVVTEFISLDNVIEIGTGEWHFPYFSDELGAYKSEELAACDAQLIGRNTYDSFAGAWPERGGDGGFADRMNAMPKYVVSSTLTDPEWNNTTVLGSDWPAEVRALKETEGGSILVAGSPSLVRALLAEGLVDELRLQVHPIVVGAGERLFAEGEELKLELAETIPLPKGMLVLVYVTQESTGS